MSTPKKTILVTGSNGQLGQELQAIADNFSQFDFVFTTRADLPLENLQTVIPSFDWDKVQYCINCAAYTAVDKAEENPTDAFLINGESVGELAAICNQHGIKLIHISTDYVFNGKATGPIKEEDAVDPVNIYGASKLKGEQLALTTDPNTLIIRTSWVYSSFGNNFVKTIARLCSTKKDLTVVNDQAGCPTYAANIARVIMEAIISIENGNQVRGIFHYCDEGIATWYQFALKIKEYLGLGCNISPVSSGEYTTAAKRPGYSVLDTSRIKSLLNMTIPRWEDSLKKCVARLQPTIEK